MDPKNGTAAQQQPTNAPNGAEGGNQATSQRQKDRSDVSQVAALLRDGITAANTDGADGDGGADGTGELNNGEPGEASGDGKKRPPKTLVALAETLGVKVEDLYEVEFRDGTNGEGETRTLGQLKDQLAQTSDLDAREIKFEEKRVSAENELLRARQDLSYIMSQLPQTAITPEIKAKATKERERIEKIERNRTLNAIPEWTDEEIEQTERNGIAEFMTAYGFEPHDLGRINDHRWLKLLRDNWQRKVRTDRAIAKMEEDRGKPAGNAAASGQPAAGKKPNGAATGVKVNAQREQTKRIGALLREGA